MQWEDRIGRRLKLRDLHIFMAVAQHGSMGKAAKQLAVSQPVVSKAVSDLERTLKVRLVDRTAQGVEPTLFGSALLRWGTVVFDDLRRGVKEIEFLADPTAGEVRIASPEVLNASFVPAVIDRLAGKFPRLVFHALQGQSLELYKMLRERRADLAVSYLTGPFEHDDLTAEVLYSDSLAVVAAPDSKWVRGRTVALAELVDEPWCLPTEGSVLRAVIARAFQEKGLPMPRHVVVSDSVQLLQALAVTSRFLFFASKMTRRLRGNRVVLKAVPVDLHIAYGGVGIVTLKDRTISPATQLFIECARDLAKPLAEP